MNELGSPIGVSGPGSDASVTEGGHAAVVGVATSLDASSGGRTPISVAIAEDSYLIRDALAMKLSSAPEVEIAAVCCNGNELQAAIAAWSPQVVLTDIRMPPSGTEEGIRIAAALHDSDPQVGVVVLSQYAEPAYAIALLEHGTGGRAYLLKERVRKTDELIGAIKAV